MSVQEGLSLCQGYVPEKHYTNQTQNLKVGVMGLTKLIL